MDTSTPQPPLPTYRRQYENDLKAVTALFLDPPLPLDAAEIVPMFLAAGRQIHQPADPTLGPDPYELQDAADYMTLAAEALEAADNQAHSGMHRLAVAYLDGQRAAYDAGRTLAVKAMRAAEQDAEWECQCGRNGTGSMPPGHNDLACTDPQDGDAR